MRVVNVRAVEVREKAHRLKYEDQQHFDPVYYEILCPLTSAGFMFGTT